MITHKTYIKLFISKPHNITTISDEVMTRQAVKVVHSPRAIKILIDPTRREILRQLTFKPQTATQLAEKMHLTKSTIGHHIAALRKFKFIKTKMAKPGSHGILEKYYEPKAVLFIEDYNKVPNELRKDFLNLHIERLRGVFSAFQIAGQPFDALQLFNGSQKEETDVAADFDLMYELAREIAKQMTILGKKYEGTETEMDGETLFIKLYTEALRTVMSKDLWKNVFQKIITIKAEFLK